MTLFKSCATVLQEFQRMADTRRRRLLLLKKKLLLMKLIKGEKQRLRRWGVHPKWGNRMEEGDYHTLMVRKRQNDAVYFHNYTRMSPALFDQLEHLIASSIKKIHPTREVLSPGHRLAITLRFLETGDSFVSIAQAFRVGNTTVRGIVLETCAALWDVLQPLYLPAPSAAMWENAAEEYERFWQFPNCCGAIQGKHVMIQQPRHSGTNSVVLMGVANKSYEYLVVEIGPQWSQSDGVAFKLSSIGRALDENTLLLPKDCNLPGTNTVVPHVLLGDESFQLRKNLLIAYSEPQLDGEQRVFNQRLNRARRCCENAFGIMAARFRIFHRPIKLNPESVNLIIKAAVVMHNFLLREEQLQPATERAYCPLGYADFVDETGTIVDGQWRADVQDLHGLKDSVFAISSSVSQQAGEVRDAFKTYFSSAQETK